MSGALRPGRGPRGPGSATGDPRHGRYARRVRVRLSWPV